MTEKKRCSFYRWRLFRQSRSRRLGAILRYKGQEKELSGGEPMTTNNRMELLAAIEGLSALKQPCRVILTSDSKYLVDAVTKGWVYGWQKKGWKKATTAPP